MSMLKTTFIYGLFDPLEPEVIRYVGKSNNPKARLSRHISHSKIGHGRRDNWIKKMIFEGRKPETKNLDEVYIADWEFWEIFYVKQHKSKKLTNFCKGGNGSSEEDYKRLSLEKYKRVVQIDFKSHEIINTFLNISQAANYIKAKSNSRISDCCNGKIHTSMGYIWRFLDKEGNIIEGKKIRKTLLTAKRVAQIDINTNKIIKIYNSLVSAENENNLFHGNISRCCAGKRHSDNGFIWRHIDENDNIILPKIKGKIRQVAMLDSKNNIIKIFLNSEKAAEFVGLNRGDAIIRNCKNKKNSVAGYQWRFYDNNLNTIV